jgi:hypothetical protein
VLWGYRADPAKILHRDRYPTLFWAHEAAMGFVAVWSLASVLFETRGPNSMVFAIVVLGFAVLLTVAKDHDDRRNSQPRG